MNDQQLFVELSTFPTNLKKEVEEFINLLKNRSKKPSLQTQRKFCSAKGFFSMKDNFDEDLDDFKDYMR